MKIIINKLQPGSNYKYEAMNGDDVNDPTYGYGNTPSEALGHFAISHSPELGIEIVNGEKLAKVAEEHPELLKEFEKFLSTMPEGQTRKIMSYYWLPGHGGKRPTFDDMAVKLHTNPERVRQIVSKQLTLFRRRQERQKAKEQLAATGM